MELFHIIASLCTDDDLIGKQMFSFSTIQCNEKCAGLGKERDGEHYVIKKALVNNQELNTNRQIPSEKGLSSRYGIIIDGPASMIGNRVEIVSQGGSVQIQTVPQHFIEIERKPPIQIIEIGK